MRRHYMIESGTLGELENAVAADLREVFRGKYFYNTLGNRVPLRVYTHAAPIRAGEDDLPADDDLPEPCIIVSLENGSQSDEESGHNVSVLLDMYVADGDPDHSGHIDLLNMISTVIGRYGRRHDIERRYTISKPFEWALSPEDLSPIYRGAMRISVTVPAVSCEDPLA